jgi:hypothetical protein
MKGKSLLVLILMLIGVTVSGFFGPWWAPAVFVVLLSMLMKLTAKQGMWNGAISLLIVYTVMSAMMLGKDDSGLIGKTGTLLGGLSAPLMVVVTGLIGGVTGLLSGWLGSSLSKVMPVKKIE